MGGREINTANPSLFRRRALKNYRFSVRRQTTIKNLVSKSFLMI
jgi:hypothetical protein